MTRKWFIFVNVNPFDSNLFFLIRAWNPWFELHFVNRIRDSNLFFQDFIWFNWKSPLILYDDLFFYFSVVFWSISCCIYIFERRNDVGDDFDQDVRWCSDFEWKSTSISVVVQPSVAALVYIHTCFYLRIC